MDIRLIIAQYPQNYPGESMPNVVDAWDEYTLDDNYEGYEAALKHHQDQVGTTYEAVRVAVIQVPDQAILDLFEPPTLPASLQEPS